ncbi:serine/threonine-protein phosphatase 7 long form homolog [Andrographis paniculata]|uniref:serine/threonine-protein phosphatase 7 long form homolog n=1 Tax=Andrographis paniculata TaxID=175694 RepID=UPI0021E8922B|nr:serine/threonine-protein phosphatase 7 long form homolog [Andrographis paniculata]XP_051135100.1 serine/threonine-protein phosphatase 7 long form homolog [Andrographis paniculata]XP_051135101.1 serine/threonine-protein phosphatase 7 long form homolog [Andrographis paniculata]XP_051135102.1 serine/threonine-protein phosphatase 7 long form homolog [Andrographis paniculata]
MDAGLGHTLHPGPIDDSILTLQDHHRSTDIWNGHDFEPLTCRRCDGHFWRLGVVHPRVQHMMLKAGFYGVYKAGRIRLDHALITALVERWRPETHTFHLPVGETTVTLQDISVLWGLPVDGEPITGVDTNRSMVEWQEICNELLGFRPPPEDFDRGRLKIRCLQERFKTLPEGASEDTVKFYARAYILQLLGGQLLSDMSNNKVKLMYLPLLRDFETAGRFSWGSAVLACLYRALCRATKPETSDICGPLVLLQIWAWERMTFIRPGRLEPRELPPPDIVAGEPPLPAAPYGSRWNVGFKLESVGKHVLVRYRDQLDNMKDDQFVWEPYPLDVLDGLPEYCISGRRIWQSVSPLICFDVVEFYHPDRVLRQFGQQQPIPVACDTIPDIHLTDRRGRQNYDWAHHHKQFVDMWAARCDRVVTSPPIECPVDQNNPYIIWYRQITRLLIGNPASRPNTGYSGEGGTVEGMAQSLQKIYHRATDAIHQGWEISGEDALREIQDICAYSLRTVQDTHRLTVKPELLSPGAAAVTPFVAPRAPRGRPKKRGGFSGGSATEQRRRGSYAQATMSTSVAVSHSPLSSNLFQSNIGQPDTPQTWDSSLSASEFQDTKDPNALHLDSEATDTRSHLYQALGKIQDICACALRTCSKNQNILLEQEPTIPVGPKTKRCKPRRRGTMTGYLLGESDPYSPLSPAPSTSMRLNDSPGLPHDISEQDMQPSVAPFSRDSSLVELEDNLQVEMIELDTITGSREASPSHANPSMLGMSTNPHSHEDSVMLQTGESANFSLHEDAPVFTDYADATHPGSEQEDVRGNEVLPGESDAPVAEVDYSNTEILPAEPEAPVNAGGDYDATVEFTETPPLENPDSSEPAAEEHDGSTAPAPPNQVATDSNGPDTLSNPEPSLPVAQGAVTLTPLDSIRHEVDESMPSTEEGVPSSAMDQISATEHLASAEVASEVVVADGDTLAAVGGKRKDPDMDSISCDNSAQKHDTSANPPEALEASAADDSDATNKNAPAAVKEDGHRTYKRQRRTVANNTK